jgi:dihydrofolate synthase/folylpolyglutamate synthase
MSGPGAKPCDDISYPGEPGLGGARPPFAADNETTRWLFALNRKGIRPGLRRIRGLLEDLGHPERDFRILVTAGTNGKGSTTRMLARLLQDAGHRVASFTSPHLLQVYERLAIDDRPVEPDLFCRTAEALRASVDRHQASWFETLSATSLAVAREVGVDVFCCETGLGGRLDASNALPHAALLLTGVSLDHQHILGGTVAEIAAEKLGLLKAGAPLFTAVTADLRAQVFAAAVAAGSPCHFLDELTSVDERGEVWDLTTRRRRFAGLPAWQPPALRRNAALALLCLDELSAAGMLDLPSDPAASLRRAFLPGRFQRVLRAPDVLVDTAHNAEALTVALTAFLARPCAGHRIVLFGGLADKDPGDGTGRLLARADAVLAAPVGLPRSRNPGQLKSLMDRWGLAADNAVEVHADLEAALSALAVTVGPDDAVLVCGSGFLVAEVLHALGYRSLEETRGIREAGPVLERLRNGATT